MKKEVLATARPAPPTRKARKGSQPRLKAPVKAPVEAPSTWAAWAGRAPRRAIEIALVAMLVLLACGLRLWRLESLPSGLHGDECVVGIKALRIINGEEPLAPYVFECGGFPAGAIWLTLLVLKMIGPHTILSLRLGAAFMGVVAVVLLYFFARRWIVPAPNNSDEAKPDEAKPDEAKPDEAKPGLSWETLAVALVAGVLLAVSNWHLHLSRVGHALAPWPPFAILAAWAALEALRRARDNGSDDGFDNSSTAKNLGVWVLGGAVSSLGFYVYNGHAVLWATVTLFAGVRLLGIEIKRSGRSSGRNRGARGVANVLLCGAAWVGGAALTLWPLIGYARSNWSVISERAARDSVFNTSEWLALNHLQEKIGALAGRYGNWWQGAMWEAKPDNYVDSLGFAPLMPWLLAPLALAGAWWGWKKYPLVVPLCVLLCLVLPLTTVVSVNGNSRRPFGMLPFLLLLVSIGAVEIARRAPLLLARKRGAKIRRSVKIRARRSARVAAVGVVLAWLSAIVFGESRLYWGLQPQMEQQKFVYGRDLSEFALWARGLPPDSYVLFACPRWSIGYEVNLWLAPALRGEDRSREFAPPEKKDGDLLAFDSSDPTLGRPVWVMLGDYAPNLLPQLQARYPGGRVYDPPGEETPSFVAYFPPV